jgi:serine/threonine protein kinase
MVGATVPNTNPVRTLGRYALHGEIAVGGMATVHFGRLHGSVGFSRTVAIKRLHKQYARDPEFVSMFLDEARLAARIRHPNVVPTLDVVAEEGELFVVMEYIHGESLSRLVKEEVKNGRRIPPRIVGALLSGTLQGLHAAHEARDERGQPLNIVHRDVSPQNILVGLDGTSRVLDFGVAKAAGRIHTTKQGQIKGKLPYMAPEQLSSDMAITRLVDVYAASVCLWEALTGLRLFSGENEAVVLAKVLQAEVHPPSRYVPEIPPALDEVVMYGLARDPDSRYQTARDMALAIEQVMGGVASAAEISDWMERVAGEVLAARGNMVAAVEQQTETSSSEQVMSEISSMRRAFTETVALAPPQGLRTPDMQQPMPVGAMTGPVAVGNAGYGMAPPGFGAVTQSQFSQLSSISISRSAPFEQGPTRRNYITAALIGVITVLVLAGVALLFVRHSSGPPVVANPEPIPAPTPSATAPPVPTETAVPLPGTTPIGAVLPAGAEPSAVPTGASPSDTPRAATKDTTTKDSTRPTEKAAESTRSSGGSSGSGTSTSSSAGKRSGSSSGKSQSGSGSQPSQSQSQKPCLPYTVDAQGNKHFNRDCI